MDDLKRAPADLTNLDENSDFCSQGHTLTSLDYLLTAYREALDENEFLTYELELNTKMMVDHQTALKSANNNIDRMKQLKQKLEKSINKLHYQEVKHSELMKDIKESEDRVSSFRNKMREDVEKLKKHCSQHVSNDEEEFAKKLNELEAKFNEEKDRLLGEINQRQEQLNVMQAKAEFQHYQTKEDLRKKHANEMKANNVHVQCRSAELDLKKEIRRLEQSIAERSKSTTASKKIQGIQMTKDSNAANPFKKNNSPALTADNKRKRKLFNVDHNFLDF